jgi:hypothetical protein
VPFTSQDLSHLASSERPMCNSCKILGMPCDRVLPKCRYCASLGRTCTYDMGSHYT